MDDGYLIHESKEYLQHCMTEIRRVCRELGITINEKKTQILRIDKGFTWLKIKYHITPTGKVIKRIPHDTVVRMRRKLKKLKRKLDAGLMTYEDIDLMYKSWCGNVEKYNSYQTLQNLNKLFNELYGGYR